nr:hypothetical protein [uncultured Blautia sp.]
MGKRQSYKNRKHTVAAVILVVLFTVMPFTVFAQEMNTVENGTDFSNESDSETDITPSEAPADSELDGFISESPSESSSDASSADVDNTYENVYTGAFGNGSYSGSTSSSSGEKVFHKPQLLLEDSNLSNQNLKAGTTREMAVTFRNKSRSQNVYGLKISLSTETKGICFDRNSFYVQRLTPGEAITLKQNISIEEDTAPGQVTVTFSLEYEDSRATSATGTETLTFNVTQPVCAELEVSDIPSVFYAMDTVEVSVKAMNLGRDKIYNAKVQMNADGLNPNETVFLGNVDAGNSAEGTIRIYVKEGAQGDAGKFTLTYEDSFGSSYESSTDFTYQIKDTQIQSLKVDDEQEETNGWWYSLIAVVAILLISIILLLIARLHKKNILLEEARKAASH